MGLQEKFDRFVSAGHSPAYVVAVPGVDGAGPDACLVGFATQCSIDPPRFAICLSKVNRTTRMLGRSAGIVAVHRLRLGDDAAARWFGGISGDDTDPFGRWSWSCGIEDVPLIEALPDRLVGREVSRHDVGDHLLVVVEPLEVHGDGEGEPFTVTDASDISPGHDA